MTTYQRRHGLAVPVAGSTSWTETRGWFRC